MPEPILVSIAAALAGKASTSLWELVRTKFSGDDKALAELDAASDQPEDQERITRLAERLEEAGKQDPEFAKQLHAEWQQVNTQNVSGGMFNNQFNGPVGKNAYIDTVHGDLRL
ncbi:hypothetical protein BJF85_14610 [Saccharomonospora sp. CUA-673]|uniref:hypothetical protein n=1 Tax=Saccharomonospora sp. CUA-673 TaxID=1904969 RepID=UPI000963E1E3|nr:hypothetical protein [Saccharomonospora sp. CUA-673]OLT47855.1 hypothetical protein BJF85_14610 [Saccharomonospora sp. CUA-673]